MTFKPKGTKVCLADLPRFKGTIKDYYVNDEGEVMVILDLGTEGSWIRNEMSNAKLLYVRLLVVHSDNVQVIE